MSVRLQECLETAEKIMTSPLTMKLHLGDQTSLFDDATSSFRWFLLPSEAYDVIKTAQKPSSSVLPFQVKCLLTFIFQHHFKLFLVIGFAV